MYGTDKKLKTRLLLLLLLLRFMRYVLMS